MIDVERYIPTALPVPAELPGIEHVSTREAAKIAGLTDKGVRHALEKKRLAGFKIGGRWRVWVDDIPVWKANSARARRCNLELAQSAHGRGRTCPRCGILSRGLCPDCRAEMAGEPYSPGGAFWSHE